MIALSILDVKEFMNILLRTDTFDSFLLREGSITTCMAYHLDGRAKADFFSPEDEAYGLVAKESYVPFSLVRPTCFDIIKGKRTPSSFQFVFQLSSENQKRTVSSIKLVCTNGISCHIFSMDKSLEQAWDDMVKVFLRKHRIAFESLS